VARLVEDLADDVSDQLPASVPWQYRFAVFFGVPAMVCLYLVWWLTSSLDVQLKVIMTNQSTLLAAQQAVSSDAMTYRRELETHTRILEAIRYSQYQICINGLQPGRDTSACLGGGRQLTQDR
jgi:hypothetical protein